MELSQRLCDFAVSVYPRVRRSLAWKVLACKKLMEFKLSSALQPTVARVRAATARTRDQSVP